MTSNAYTPTEDQFQASVCDLLDVYVQRRELMYFAVPNGAHRNKVVAAKLKRTGVKAGAPDIVVVFPRVIIFGGFGRKELVCFWELKRPGRTKVLKGFQADWQRELTSFGFHHAVINSLDDVQRELRENILSVVRGP